MGHGPAISAATDDSFWYDPAFGLSQTLEADMSRIAFAVSVVALALAGWFAPHIAAQDTKSARGTVTAMTADGITVKAGAQELRFAVDAKTLLEASGAGTAAKKAAVAGRPGPKLADFIKVGDAVDVSYHEAGMLATRVRKVSSPGPGGGTTSEPKAEMSNGTVDAVTATSLTVAGSVSGGAFKQTFTIDRGTKVIGHGAGTAAQAAGGKMVITDYVTKGDRVSVSYHAVGDSLHATEVRVTAKAK